jgi:hypothetical protein
VDLVAVNPEGTLLASGEIEDWEALNERGTDTIVDMDGDVDPGIPEAPNVGFNRSVLVTATALTCLGMSGRPAVARLRECRPGALFNEAFAGHVLALPARRIRVETL